VVERTAVRRHRDRVGRTEEIVVEGPSKRDPGVTTGRTRQNKLVHFRSERGLRPGTYGNVLVTDAASHFLHGELLEVTAEPTHRVRIPVLGA
jgi:tRNA-2-methylthio-N6-dimethylallyladenosine synthase